MDGRCQCGAVRFHTDADKPMQIFICHCLECRWVNYPDHLPIRACSTNTFKQAASSYGLSAIFPSSGVHFTPSSAEHMTKWTRITSEGRPKDCWFCKVCGTRLYHHCPGQELLTVKAGALEGLTAEMLAKGVHIWAKRAITPIPDGAERYDEEPPENVDELAGNDK